MTYEDAVNRLNQRFGADAIKTSTFRDNRRVHVAADLVYAVLQCLKEECGFDMLAELGGADYLHYPNATDCSSSRKIPCVGQVILGCN